MMIKTLQVTLGVLVAFSVWCAAVMFAAGVAIITLHVVAMGGFTVYRLLYS